MEHTRSSAAVDKVKVALIGAGAHATATHYPSLVELADVEIVGMCDLVAAKAAEMAARFGVPRTFTDYREMLDKTRPQAVYAIVPPHQLFDVAADLLMRGHDLFIEKPPGVTVFQTECLARAAALKKAITGVGFQRRYHPLFLRCREEVVRHGPVNQVVAAFYKLQPPGEPYPYYRGAIDILTCDAIHALDMCRFYAGGEVRAVASDVQRIDQPWPMSWNAVISFDNGVTAVLLANWRTGGRRLTLELHAAGCSAFANADGAAEVIADNQPAPVRRWSHIEAAGSDKTHIHQGYLNQARAFIDAVKSRRELHNSIADTVKTMRLVEQVYGSAI